MRQDLHIFFNDPVMEYYIPGEMLLQWMQDATYQARSTFTGMASVSTDEANPTKLDSFQRWVEAWSLLNRDPSYRSQTCYFEVAGRKIKKLKNKASGGDADGFYMADVVLSGNVGAAEGTIWYRSSGASYREFAKFLQASGADRVDWSIVTAGKMRRILRDGSYVAPGGAADPYTCLPLLCAVMFVSEPARNPRAFPIGLMTLDLMGEQYSASYAPLSSPGSLPKTYTMDRVLAHPERIDPGFSGGAVLAKPQKGPVFTTTKVGRRNVKTLVGVFETMSTKKQLATVEGKYSASPSGSSHSSQTVDLRNDYIQRKEASILVRWLAKQLNKKLAHQDIMFSSVRDAAGMGVPNYLTADDSHFTPEQRRNGVSDMIGFYYKHHLLSSIRTLIRDRLSGSDLMR
ncbi:MAG: hypothetical protein ACRD7E_05245 [Bryobacteraceae bacterium]